MQINESEHTTRQLWVHIRDDDGTEMARGSIVLVYNQLHQAPYAYLEDIFTNSTYRGQGLFGKVMEQLLEMAEREGCYKFVATSRYSRPNVHAMYEKLGITDDGKKFRKNL